jgi:DNA modification methylase
MAVTSPPYFNTRVYDAPAADLNGWRGCLGNEPSMELYIQHLSQIFAEVKRVLRNDGTLWLNLGDCYAGSGSPGGDFRNGKQGDIYLRPYKRKGAGLKTKDQCLIPHRVALSLQGYAVIYADEIWKLLNTLQKAREEDDWEAVKLVEETLRKWAIAIKLANSSGWWLRSTIIWEKSNPAPCGAQDRPTTDFEYVFLLSKSKRYYYDSEAIKEPQKEVSIKRAFSQNHLEKRKDYGKDIYALSSPAQQKTLAKLADSVLNGEPALRNKRCIWTFATSSLKEDHYASFPERLITPMILAGSSSKVCAECGAPQKRILQGQQTIGWKASCSCNKGTAKSIILDPFMGAGTTALVATELGRDYIGIEIGEKYIEIAHQRLKKFHLSLPLNSVRPHEGI